MEYIFHILILICIYSTLAASLDLVVGYAGLLSVSHAAFYGIGAYASALLTISAGAPFVVGLAVGIAVAYLMSLLVSFPSLRLHEDYFVIASLGFQLILLSVINNWTGVTRGPLGIRGIPFPEVLGWTIQTHLEFFLLAILLAAASYGIVVILASSPYGRVLKAIREDEVFAQALGKNTLRFKTTAFAVSAALAALAGSLYAHYVSYVSPINFGVMESVLVLSMVVIGGAGSRWGPLVGALVLVLIPELLRALGLPGTLAGDVRQIIYGALLVVMMMARPAGLVGRYHFTK